MIKFIFSQIDHISRKTNNFLDKQININRISYFSYLQLAKILNLVYPVNFNGAYLSLLIFSHPGISP